MPRRPRIHIDEVPQHIVQRGHNCQPCFFGEEDYHTYLHWLGEALRKEHCALHAYVLMANHVHLLLTPKDARAVPRLIIALGAYASDVDSATLTPVILNGPAHGTQTQNADGIYTQQGALKSG